uniref:MADF domain-containing protein n=1 Tax=Oryzias latipes TaxID=8090 RepID=A0A3P9JMM9_ORYLA
PSLIKEKKEGFYNSQLDLKQETDTVMEIPTYEEDENSEADLNNQQSFNVTDKLNDKHDSDYKVLDKRELLWSGIAQQMGLDVEEVKHKWKSLRDTYTRKKHEEDCRSGQAAKNTKKPWKFMKVMEFLATSTEFRSCVSSAIIDREASASTSSGSTFSSPNVTRFTSNKRKRPETPDLLDRYLLSKEAREIEKEERRREKEERREQRREQQNDENYLFVLGLIPALRRLSPAVQSSVKLRIHQLLHDAEFGQASSAFFSQQSPLSYHQVPPQTPPNNGCSTTSWLP